MTINIIGMKTELESRSTPVGAADMMNCGGSINSPRLKLSLAGRAVSLITYRIILALLISVTRTCVVMTLPLSGLATEYMFLT